MYFLSLCQKTISNNSFIEVLSINGVAVFLLYSHPILRRRCTVVSLGGLIVSLLLSSPQLHFQWWAAQKTANALQSESKQSVAARLVLRLCECLHAYETTRLRGTPLRGPLQKSAYSTIPTENGREVFTVCLRRDSSAKRVGWPFSWEARGLSEVPGGEARKRHVRRGRPGGENTWFRRGRRSL